MIVGTARVVLRMPENHSLKDKRQVVKSLLAQVRNRFQVSAAEVESQDQWQLAVLGLATVSNSASQADEVIGRALHFIEMTHHDAELIDVQTEIVQSL